MKPTREGRLFTFGCSLTQYKWPTWADILGREFNFFENWGLCGGGNLYIFNSVVECLLKNNLNENDTVLIMWTNVEREDGYKNYLWHQLGHIDISQLKRDKNFDERGYLIRDISLIYATKKLLEANNVPYTFTSMVPITNSDQYSRKYIYNADDVELLYKEAISCIKPSMYETVFNFDWSNRPFKKSIFKSGESEEKLKHIYNTYAGVDWPPYEDYKNNNLSLVSTSIINEISQFFNAKSNALRDDLHPSPLEHLKYLDLILPEFFVSKETREWTMDIDLKLRSGTNIDDLWRRDANRPKRL